MTTNRQKLGMMTSEEAAEALGITEYTLAEMRRAGTGPVYSRPGKAVYYLHEDVAAWLREHRVPAGKFQTPKP